MVKLIKTNNVRHIHLKLIMILSDDRYLKLIMMHTHTHCMGGPFYFNIGFPGHRSHPPRVGSRCHSQCTKQPHPKHPSHCPHPPSIPICGCFPFFALSSLFALVRLVDVEGQTYNPNTEQDYRVPPRPSMSIWVEAGGCT